MTSKGLMHQVVGKIFTLDLTDNFYPNKSRSAVVFIYFMNDLTNHNTSSCHKVCTSYSATLNCLTFKQKIYSQESVQ